MCPCCIQGALERLLITLSYSHGTHTHPESTILTSRSRAHCEYHMLMLFVSFQVNPGKHRHSIFIPNSLSVISSTDVDSVGEKEQLDTYSDSPR